MLGPSLRGDRIALRPRIPELAMTFFHYLQDPEVTRLLGSKKTAPTVQDETEYLEESSVEEDSIHWAIYFEGNCIGSASIENINQLHRHCTLGLFIGEPGLWGLGLGRDTCETIIDHVFAEYPMNFIRSDYYESNTASKHLLGSLGFKVCGRYHEAFFSEGNFVDHILMELSRENWIEKNQ